jgi:5-methylthioadenosine/S-adenosylhomocysteine deaminase
MNEADLILTNATVVTMDANYRVIPSGAIALRGDSILAVGEESDILASFKAPETFDCGGKTLIPGLINSHTHAAMSLLRGLADDLRLDVWLLGYMMPVEREFVSPEFCKVGTSLACAEMIRGGVTCFADMYYFEESVAEAVAEAGMRAVCSQTVLKFPSPDAASFEDSLAAARQFIERWKDHPLVTPSVAPHAPYTCTPEILSACTELALEFDVPLHTHFSETKQEVDEWRKTHDMPVIPWVKKLGMLEAKVLAAHCVHVDDGEIHTLEHAGTGVSHNPSSNLKLASGFAPVADMLKTGLNVGVATDGPSSNNDLDLFTEMQLASFIAKAVTGDPTALPARQVFEMATSMGARAIHLGDQVGSLEPGKRADLVLIDLHQPHTLPHYDRDPNAIYSRLVYTAKSTDVTDVMVNGQWVMREGTLLTIDEAPLLETAANYAAQIDAFLIEREESVLSKLVAIGGAEREESYEVQVKVRLEDPAAILEQLEGDKFKIIRTAHYLEYDNYFSFADPSEGRLRYREDQFVDSEGEVYNVRYRLTLTGPAAEREYQDSVLLSRSRFIAPAPHSPRFYREYFEPVDEFEISKDRLRWLIQFNNTEFFINIDRILQPAIKGCFLEIKSRTWSRRDAEMKASKISELLQTLGLHDADGLVEDYPELVGEKRSTR